MSRLIVQVWFKPDSLPLHRKADFGVLEVDFDTLKDFAAAAARDEMIVGNMLYT